MPEAENTRVVREAYAAFGRADVQAVLDTMHDGIMWKPITGASSHVPIEFMNSASINAAFGAVEASV